MHSLRRRPIHTEGLVVRQLRRTHEWADLNKSLVSPRNNLIHAARIWQNGFLDLLNRSDGCGDLRTGRDSDHLRRFRAYRVDLSIPVVRESGDLLRRPVRVGWSLTDEYDHGLSEEFTLENILAQTSTDCDDSLILRIA